MTDGPSPDALKFIAGWDAADRAKMKNPKWSKAKKEGWDAQRLNKNQLDPEQEALMFRKVS